MEMRKRKRFKIMACVVVSFLPSQNQKKKIEEENRENIAFVDYSKNFIIFIHFSNKII